MSKIPTFTRGITPSGQVGGVAIPFDIADTGQGIEAQGLAALGRGATDLAAALAQIVQAEGISQFATSRAQTNKEMQSLELRLRENNDPSTYRSELKNSLQTIEDFRPKSSIGSKRFDEYMSQSIPMWEAGIDVLAFNKTKDIAEGAYISNMSDAVVGGDTDEAERIIAEARDTGVITNEQAVRDLANVPNRIIESQIGNLLNNASQFASEGNFTKAQIEVTKAELILSDPDTKIDADTKRVLRSRTNTSKASIKVLSEKSFDVQREADRDEISKAIRSGSPDVIGIIEASSLDEAEQFTWSERARIAVKRKAEGEGIITNQTIKGNLEAMAYNIHNGSVSMPDFISRLEEERYDNETIDDSAYDSLRSLAVVKFKSYQSNEMGSRIAFARNQLVTLPDELAWNEFILRLTSKFQKEQAISLRKLELDNLDIYRKALSDWFKDHPEATADEIYKTGRNMLALYRKTPEQLREENRQRGLLIRGIKPQTEEERKEQIDKIAKGIQDTVTGALNLRLGKRPFDSMRKPGSVEEFIAIYKSIPDRDKRERYYRKWSGEFK